MLKLWTVRIAASLGCLALFVGSFATAEIVLPRSWQDLDDANVRMRLHIVHFHVYDPDFIWSAVGFGTNVLVVAAMFACSAWILWLLITRWDMLLGPKSR